jgi:hypothetical protein
MPSTQWPPISMMMMVNPDKQHLIVSYFLLKLTSPKTYQKYGFGHTQDMSLQIAKIKNNFHNQRKKRKIINRIDLFYIFAA